MLNGNGENLPVVERSASEPIVGGGARDLPGAGRASSAGQDHSLASVDYSGVNLSGRDFSGLCLRKVNFTGANLSGASFKGAELWNVDFTGANIEGACFDGARFCEEVNLRVREFGPSSIMPTFRMAKIGEDTRIPCGFWGSINMVRPLSYIGGQAGLFCHAREPIAMLECAEGTVVSPGQ